MRGAASADVILTNWGVAPAVRVGDALNAGPSVAKGRVDIREEAGVVRAQGAVAGGAESDLCKMARTDQGPRRRDCVPSGSSHSGGHPWNPYPPRSRRRCRCVGLPGRGFTLGRDLVCDAPPVGVMALAHGAHGGGTASERRAELAGVGLIGAVRCDSRGRAAGLFHGGIHAAALAELTRGTREGVPELRPARGVASEVAAVVGHPHARARGE